MSSSEGLERAASRVYIDGSTMAVTEFNVIRAAMRITDARGYDTPGSGHELHELIVAAQRLDWPNRYLREPPL